MGIFSAIADSFSALWKVDPEATNEDELTVFQEGNEANRRIFSASIKTIKDLEKGLDGKPSKKKDTLSPKAKVDDATNNKTEKQEKREEEREM